MNIALSTAKYDSLKRRIKELGRPLVAFSGGVDSSFLLRAACDAVGADSVLAVTAKSPSFPATELEDAVKIARLIKVEHLLVDSAEMQDKQYTDNPPDRCFYCKSELFDRLSIIAGERGFDTVLDGANFDDSADYRPGSRAAFKFGVSSPLKECGFTKNEIRELSKELSLPTWDKPAFACLASRLPYGSQVTEEKLFQIENAETFIKSLGFRQVRVRHHGDIARIEIPPEDISRLIEKEISLKINKRLTEFGFKYVAVDIAGYRQGSMNGTLTSPRGEAGS